MSDTRFVTIVDDDEAVRDSVRLLLDSIGSQLRALRAALTPRDRLVLGRGRYASLDELLQDCVLAATEDTRYLVVEMGAVAQPAGGEHVPTCSSSLQGYPGENEESLLPRILGVWKVAIIR